MKKIIYLSLTALFLFISCEKSEIIPVESNNDNTGVESRAIRPVILGQKKNNPYSVQNMQAALDTLKKYPNELEGCMKAPALINEVEISATDLYVRFLPSDSVQHKRLMTDTTLTLFDFPLDYEIEQTGEFYHDPTASGDYTWLYTRVPIDYVFPDNITFETLEELFIMENSPYYSEEILDDDGIMKAKSVYGTGMNDLLKTVEAIAFFNTGNEYGQIKPANTPVGMQRIKKSVKKKFLFVTWYEYEYYPSGTIKVKSAHKMDKTGNTLNYSTLTEAPLKGVKIHFWDGFFKWNSTYTNEDGYYESSINYNNDLYYDLYFEGKNGNNSWTLDQVILGGLCLSLQKLSLGSGRESNDGYSTTIDVSSGGWNAGITNNAFYEYMTICDKENLTRPDQSLRVALRETGGPSSAPMLNHCMLLSQDDNTVKGLFYVYLNSTTISITVSDAIAKLLKATAPDVLLSGGELSASLTNIRSYYSTVWHELTHASNYKIVKDIKGYTYANIYWNDLIATEVGHAVSSKGADFYGIQGNKNWEQVALCEGWANYREYRMKYNYLEGRSFYGISSSTFPYTHINLFYDLENIGISLVNMEKCLTERTIIGYRDQLINIYPSLKEAITLIIKGYE